MWKIVSILLVTIALIIAWIVDYDGDCYSLPTPQNLEIRDWSEIRTWYDLDAARHNLTGNYTLMNPLDSTIAGYEELASETANGGKGWQPIGTWENPFSGNFNGRAWEIRDLFINRPGEDYVGLFGIVAEGVVIENVGVSLADVTGEGGVGGLVGYSRGTLSNCYFGGSVVGHVHVGGLVGQNCGPVSNCFASGSVIGESCVGGLVGDNSDTVSNCYASGTVIGEGAVGGLVGQNAYGNVSNSYSWNNVKGNSKVGGLVGTNLGTVSDSYANSSVVGYSRVGGLGGWNIGTVSNSYSRGSVTGDEYVGGLLGENIYGTVRNSFWDTETSGQATSGGGMGKTTEEMKNIATFSGAGWNITTVASAEAPDPAYIWNTIDQHLYPFLGWRYHGWPLSYPRGHILPAQETETIPSGYFTLTVSPPEVCTNIGEQIEIRCSIYSLIDCIVEISSVDMLLFDSYDSMTREQAMTKDSYWSAHTVYTIVGDEAYYQLKVNFRFISPSESGQYTYSGEHTEYGGDSFPIVVET